MLQSKALDRNLHGKMHWACWRRWELKRFCPMWYLFQVPIKACGKGGHWFMALHLLQQSLESRILPDLRLLNGLISSLGSQWRIAIDLFASMADFGLSPDVFAYNTVMKAVGKSKKWEVACDFFRTMLDKQVLPSIITVNTALAAVSTQKNWWLTLDMLQSLPDKMLVPDLISYRSVLKALSGCSEWQQAIRVLNDMPQQAEATDFGLALTACSKSHQWPQALQLLAILRSQEVEEDLLLLNAAMSACGRAKQWQHALFLFINTLDVDEMALTTAIAACSSFWQQILGLLNLLPKRMLSSTLLTHTPAVRSCGDASQWEWVGCSFATRSSATRDGWCNFVHHSYQCMLTWRDRCPWLATKSMFAMAVCFVLVFWNGFEPLWRHSLHSSNLFLWESKWVATFASTPEAITAGHDPRRFDNLRCCN